MDRIVLRITDNGKGFETNKVKNGVGLIGIATGAEVLGGTFEVESTPGNGCVLTVELPL